MRAECLIAEYQDVTHAKYAIETLKEGHFTLRNISVVFNKDDPAVAELEHLMQRPTDEVPTSRSVNTGILVGGSLAAPVAAGNLFGPFLVAGPLVGMVIGAAIGGLYAGLKHWGVKEDTSVELENRVKAGSVLIIVNDEDSGRLATAEELLAATNPTSLERFVVV